jgi:hypothetical protein
MVRRSAVVIAAASLAAVAAWFGMGSSTASADERRFEGWGRQVASISEAEQMADVDQSMTLVGEFVRGRGVDVGPNGPSPGDMFFFEEQLYNRSQTEVVGKSSVRCQAGVSTYICDGTLRLDGTGKIVVGGAFFAPRDNTVPVTGGSHRFKAVGGAMQIFDIRGRKSLYVLKLVR